MYSYSYVNGLYRKIFDTHTHTHTYIYIYIYIYTGRHTYTYTHIYTYTYTQADTHIHTRTRTHRGSIPGRVIQKTLKMVLHTSLLNTQHFKCKGKGVAPSSTPRCNSYWKGSLQLTLDYSRHFYFYVYIYIYIYIYNLSSRLGQ